VRLLKFQVGLHWCYSAMHEYPVTHPSLPALFDPSVPDNPVLWAVFKGRHTGAAVVDDVQQPSQCVVRTDAVMTFASRQISQPFLDKAMAHFRKIGDVWLTWPAPESAPFVAPEADCVIARLEFFDYDAKSQALADLRRLPAGCEIRPIDRQLLERCEWREDMEFYCGSADNFLAHDLGLCLMRGDEIIVEAYVSSFGETQAEIGAVTREAHRGHGYAPITCAYLIDACEQRGYAAYWSCDVDNRASIRVAQKLGYRQEKPYQTLEYRAVK
jgi:RimJ/RimL family protein N-acetyltransferase